MSAVYSTNIHSGSAQPAQWLCILQKYFSYIHSSAVYNICHPLLGKLNSSLKLATFSLFNCFVYLFDWDPQPHFPHRVNSQGRTYRDHPYHPGHSSPPGLVSHSVSSPPVLLSCILHQVRTLPSPPVLYI